MQVFIWHLPEFEASKGSFAKVIWLVLGEDVEEAREKLYLQADHTVRTDMMRFQEVVDRIVALARA